MDELRALVETRLRDFLEGKRDEARRMSPDSMELVDQVAVLTMRGGKRLRPIVLAAAYRAVAPGRGLLASTVEAGVALELLQTYLLVHDDWMDRDDERRGGPSVYAALRDAHGDEHLGAALAVLAGDLASAYASELITDAPFPHGRGRDGLRAFWQLQREVFFGQQLDLVANADVERMYDLKTGSYTVRGPAILGALLGDATERMLEALVAWANPLGIAFQLRDEILGTFGDPAATGKPAGNDLRQGKHTMLVKEARAIVPASERAVLERVLGREDAARGEIAAAMALIESSGARRLVEEHLDRMVTEATAALDAAPFSTDDLRVITHMLVDRDH
jgi:geranylgeranyl diphosphate synthase type I